MFCSLSNCSPCGDYIVHNSHDFSCNVHALWLNYHCISAQSCLFKIVKFHIHTLCHKSGTLISTLIRGYYHTHIHLLQIFGYDLGGMKMHCRYIKPSQYALCMEVYTYKSIRIKLNMSGHGSGTYRLTHLKYLILTGITKIRYYSDNSLSTPLSQSIL